MQENGSTDRKAVRLTRDVEKRLLYGVGCTLAPPGEYNVIFCAAAAMRTNATVTAATYYRCLQFVFRCVCLFHRVAAQV